DGRAEGGQFAFELCGTRSVMTAPRDEQEMARSVLGDEVARGERAERAGAPGDDHRAFEFEQALRRPRRAGFDRRHPWDAHDAVPNRELGLTGRESRADDARRG